MVPRVQVLILDEDLVDFASLLTELQGMSEASIVGFELLRRVVHGDHVFLGLLEGAGHGEEFGSEVVHAALQVFVFHLESRELV